MYATKSRMRDCGSLSHKNVGLSSKLDEIDTNMGSCFPIHVVVSVGFSSSDGRQNYSKSKMATLLKKACSLLHSILKPFFQTTFLVESIHSWGKCFWFGPGNREDDGWSVLLCAKFNRKLGIGIIQKFLMLLTRIMGLLYRTSFFVFS